MSSHLTEIKSPTRVFTRCRLVQHWALDLQEESEKTELEMDDQRRPTLGLTASDESQRHNLVIFGRGDQ